MKIYFMIVLIFSCIPLVNANDENENCIKSKLQNNVLPFIITEAKADTLPMLFLFSGDGGWKSFDANLCNELAGHNIPSIGLNSNKYFWEKKTPEQVAAEITPVLRQYLKEWNRKEIIFAGFSFGSEVTPFVYNQLPADLKSKIKIVLCLTPSDFSDFEIHLNDMLGFDGKHYPYVVSTEINKITSTPVICFWGEKEKAEFADTIRQKNVSVYFLPGGHNFTDYKTIVAIVMKAINKIPSK